MKSLLLIQFRTDESAQQERESFNRVAKEAGFFSVEAINSLDTSVDWNDPEELLNGHMGVVLGGSGEFHFTGHADSKKDGQFSQAIQNISPLVHFVITHDYPTLGVCFGHQMIGHFLGTKTIVDIRQAKAGSHDISVIEPSKKDPLFSDLPETFGVQYGHTGTLSELPPECTLLAQGEKCKYGAFKHKSSIYGVQFHPEMNRDDAIRKMRLYPEYKKNDPHFESNVKQTPMGEKVLMNFARYANNRGQ